MKKSQFLNQWDAWERTRDSITSRANKAYFGTCAPTEIMRNFLSPDLMDDNGVTFDVYTWDGDWDGQVFYTWEQLEVLTD